MLLTPLGIEKIKKLKALNNPSGQEFAKMGTPKLSLFNPMTKLFRRAYLGDTIISKTHSLYHFRKKVGNNRVYLSVDNRCAKDV